MSNLELLGEVVQYRGYRNSSQIAIARAFVIATGAARPRMVRGPWADDGVAYSRRVRTMRIPRFEPAL